MGCGAGCIALTPLLATDAGAAGDTLPVSHNKGKSKGFPYSLPSVGPGADLGVQAVSTQDASDYKSSTRR